MVSDSTNKIYAREIDRMINKLGIDFNKYKSQGFQDDIIAKYKANSVPFQNLNQGLYAVNHYFGKIDMLPPFVLSKDFIDKLRESYTNAVPVREARQSTISWETIQSKTRPFINDSNNNAYDRLILALYTLIPARRSEYYSLIWGPETKSENRLSIDGDLNIDDYKTVKTYGLYSINLFEHSTFLSKRDAILFKDIISNMPNKQDNTFIFQTAGKPYGIISFATRARNLFSKLIGQKVGLLDIRRAYEEFIRRTVLNNNKISTKKRLEYRAILELATGHSNATQNQYADKVELID